MEDKIRAAYDEMNPTPEQEERMLNALLDAQAQQAAGADVVAQATTDTPSAKRGGFKAWKAALPVAACLAVVAVVVGVSSMTTNGTANMASSGQTSATNVAPTEARSAQSEQLHTDSATEQELMATANGAADVEEPYPEPDNQFNTEEYAAVDENGFVNTRTRPLSTVSADVDTASYANVRRMIAGGSGLNDIPDGAVRAEEMLNYFTYDYAQPTGDDKFSMQAQTATCPWNPDTQLLVMGFATAQEQAPADKGANLVFLIDVSGSMSSYDKLGLLKESFATLLDSLDDRDRVSIVTYSGSERVVLDGAKGDERNRILRAINELEASGSTNGEAGLRMAYEVAQDNYIEGGVNRIVMASDGDLNVGMTSESDLFDFVEQKRETGVYLSVLGFGSGNYKDTKMEVLADHGNGSYHYIDCTAEAERVLSEKLMANLVPFADDVKVQVEFNPSQVKAYRLIGYENRALADEDFTNDAVDAGDVGPSSQFTVAYEIVPVGSPYEVAEPRDLKYGSDNYAGSNSSDWLTCSLRYRAFSDGQVHEQSLVVDASSATDNPSDDWKLASSVIEFGMLAGDSKYVGTATIGAVLSQLDSMNLNEERQGFADLVRQAEANTSVSRPEDGGSADVGHSPEQRNGFNRERP